MDNPIDDFPAGNILVDNAIAYFFVGTILVPTDYERKFHSFKTFTMEAAQEVKDALPPDIRRSVDLPICLTEKIIAFMPYPIIFKARCLSKSWRTKLSQIKPNDDAENKLLKRNFQSHVHEWSNNWARFCPTGLCGKIIYVHDVTSDLWRTILLPEVFWESTGLQIERKWLYGFPRSTKRLCVLNIFTRKYKQLQSGPHADTVLGKILVIDISTERFKVIVLCTHRTYHCWVEIYDSNLNGWTRKKLVILAGFTSMVDSTISSFYYKPAYLNGVFYQLALTYKFRGNFLLAYNVEEGTVKQIELSFVGLPPVTLTELVVCKGSLLSYDSRRISLLKIDLDSQEALEVARAPPHRGLWYLRALLSDGDSIFLMYTDCRVVSYNMVKDEWSFFRLPGRQGDAPHNYDWIQGTFWTHWHEVPIPTFLAGGKLSSKNWCPDPPVLDYSRANCYLRATSRSIALSNETFDSSVRVLLGDQLLTEIRFPDLVVNKWPPSSPVMPSW